MPIRHLIAILFAVIAAAGATLWIAALAPALPVSWLVPLLLGAALAVRWLTR